MRRLLIATACVLSGLAYCQELDREKILQAIEKIGKQQKALADEITGLKSLMGVHSGLEDLGLLPAENGFSERVKLRTEDGAEAYREGDYERAKEAFRKAWEASSGSVVTNFNLGMSYQRLGNIPLAKKMFKATLDLGKDFEHKDRLEAFLEGRDPREPSLSSEERLVRTALVNLKKEAETYMRTQGLPMARRMRASVKAVREMEEVFSTKEAFVQEFGLFVGETYAAFELYDQAFEAFKRFEESMKDKELPDDYYTRLLQVEQKKQEVEGILSQYIGNEPKRGRARKVRRDLDELKIFAAQMNEFVQEVEGEDEDFEKITQRLSEYQWGGRAGRHVVVVDRYGQLLFSSLEGTLPIEQYQDTRGQQFLKNITKLAGRLELKQVEVVPLKLALRSETAGVDEVPYLVLYTYIPKHESFIIVRYPTKDLS